METDIKLTKLAKCAGCGAKVGAGTLAALLDGLEPPYDPNLLVGFDRSDDAAVYRINDGLALVQTVDFFPPVADDPYVFGQIAAANALSDVYAMGGEPRLAQNIMCVPESMDGSAVREILRGGYDKAVEAGVLITGGHSIYDDEPKYGLAVTGFVHPDRLIKNCTAEAGDVLFLTKPLGTGILLTAAKAGLLDGSELDALYLRMTRLNRAARDAMSGLRIHACTDVTGFSLLGHGLEMAEGSGVALRIEAAAVPIPAAALEFARMGLIPAGAYRNRRFAANTVDTGAAPLEVCDALYDPQTSGGLLVAVHPGDAAAFSAAMPGAAKIGAAVPAAAGKKPISLV